MRRVPRCHRRVSATVHRPSRDSLCAGLEQVCAQTAVCGVQRQRLHRAARGGAARSCCAACSSCVIQVVFVNQSAITLASPLPSHVLFPHSIFVSYDALTRSPVGVSASPVLLLRPTLSPPASPPPPSLQLNSAFFFVESSRAALAGNGSAYMPCPSIVLNPTGMQRSNFASMCFFSFFNTECLFLSSALISGRPLKVARCIQQEVAAATVSQFCAAHSRLCQHHADASNCAGSTCASVGPKPSASSTLIVTGAVNNADNAVAPALARLLPNRTGITVVDVAVDFEMLGHIHCRLSTMILHTLHAEQRAQSFVCDVTCSRRSYDASMDQTDLDFSNHRNFLTQEPGARGGGAWRAAGGAFDFRFVKLARS